AWAFYYVGITYNNKYVNHTITSWSDLLNPALKGKVGLVSPSNNIGQDFLAAITQLNGGNYTTGNISAAVPFLQQLKPNVAMVSASTTTVQQGLVSGNIWVGVDSTPNDVPVALKDSNLSLVIPTPVFGAGLYMCVASNIPSNVQQMSLKFVNYLLSSQVESEYMQQVYFVPTNTQATVSAGQFQSFVAPSVLSKVSVFDAQATATYTAQWTTQFEQIMS
ncbi:MAG: extracellular solute-binding protein, partial [Nitrososphaerota archaeon]|nr:extracellular solute-binding protein [Nitrososphaerota archaeon]